MPFHQIQEVMKRVYLHLLLFFNNPFTLSLLVGSPISVPKVPSPSQEQVNHYHQLYMESLTNLFHKHKTSYGLADTHQISII